MKCHSRRPVSIDVGVILLFVIFFLNINYVFPQGVGINETAESPDPSAMLDVKSLDKGILVPRMTLEQRDLIGSPAQGLLIYQTDGEAGYYYFKGVAWTRIGEASEIVTYWQSTGDDIYFQAGKVGIGTNSPETELEVSGIMRLTPSEIPAVCTPGLQGSVYYDSFLDEVCFCNGQNWMQMDGGGICRCPDLDGDGRDICDPGSPYDWDGYPADCDDTDPDIYPGATEICDNKDNDCDGETDEAPAGQTWYRDQDLDGWGNDNNTMFACTPDAGYVSVGGDCDDNDFNINPGMTETCNGVDDDCDQEVDEESCPDYPNGYTTCDGSTGSCFYNCLSGWLDCNGYLVDGCEYMLPAIQYQDTDGDGYGNPLISQQAYDCPVPGWSDNNLDCDDTDPDVNPGETEICGDTIDNDCDGLTDAEDPDCIDSK